jgi:hypothetical protein
VDIEPARSKPCPKTHQAYQARGGKGKKTTGAVGHSGSGRIEGFSRTPGWQPTCDCDGSHVWVNHIDNFEDESCEVVWCERCHILKDDADDGVGDGLCPPVPAIVLDPFCGSGTTARVARNLGRSAIGLDVSFEYLKEHAMVRARDRQSVVTQDENGEEVIITEEQMRLL